jgi:hypothetical protein
VGVVVGEENLRLPRKINLNGLCQVINIPCLPNLGGISTHEKLGEPVARINNYIQVIEFITTTA